MFTLNEIQVLMSLLDAGIRASGLPLFQNDGGTTLQSILAKLQDMVDSQQKEIRNGKD